MTRTRKVVLVSLLALSASGVLAGGWYYTWLMKPPPMPKDIDEAMAVLKSPRYQRLPDSRREPYLEKTREIFEAMSADQRAQVRKTIDNDPESRKAVQQAMEDRMYQMARNYVNAEPDKRKQMVNQFVAMMELGQRFGRGFGSATRPAATPPDTKDEPTPEQQAEEKARREQRRNEFMKRMQEQVEKGNPQKQQYVTEFFKAIRDRRAELGLDPNPPPPRRPGG